MSTAAPIQIIALTPAGAALGERLCQHLPGAQLHLPTKLQCHSRQGQGFASLGAVLALAFQQRLPVVAIMATGIVVRHLAPLLQGKDVDPAVVVMDERGRFAISLVDPQGYLSPVLTGWPDLISLEPEEPQSLRQPGPAVYVGCREYSWPADWLRLRPKNLVAGVGCNKGTPVGEILALLEQTLSRQRLSRHCLSSLATITLKQDEAGLIAAARRLGVPLQCFPPEELALIEVPNPSPVVQRHMGVASVCEAAALRAAGSNILLVPKQKTANVTLAIAQVGSGSSA